MGSHTLTEKNCLINSYPIIASEWNYEKNTILCPGLSPHNIAYGSMKNVWWKCRMGHEWLSRPNNRTGSNMRGCPYCSNKRVYKDNCLATKAPELVKEWHPIKNGKLTPNDVVFASNKKVWWQCEKGHEWRAVIGSRSCDGRNCPYCSNQKVCEDNCVATKNPELMQEWNFGKNKDVSPYDIFPSDQKNVWWKCSKGHEWKNTTKDRVYGGINCHVCNRIILNNGVVCASMIEAYYYLEFSIKGLIDGIDFLHDRKYAEINPQYIDIMGKMRYDFYFPKENEYLEVTSYTSGAERWVDYFSTIALKSQYVRDILECKFKFISRKLSKQDLSFVRQYMVT